MKNYIQFNGCSLVNLQYSKPNSKINSIHLKSIDISFRWIIQELLLQQHSLKMTRHKKNNKFSKTQTKSSQPSNEPSGPTEEILQEVIQIRELFQKYKQRLRESKHQFGYLLSNKWLGVWKSYTGYDALIKDGNPQQGKGFGKKKPTSKINQDLLAKTDNKYAKVPESLLQFQYLNYPIDEDYENEKQYIIIDQQLWTALQAKYPDAICIRRPLRKRQSGQPFVDVNLHSFNFIIIGKDQVEKCKKFTEAEYEKIMKRNKKDQTLQKMFVMKKIRIPSIWNLQNLRTFMKKFVPLYSDTKDVQEIKFWRMQNYLSFTQMRQNLCSFFREEVSGVLANALINQEEDQKDLDDFLKSFSVILIVCEGVQLQRMAPPDKISGYCEQCIQDRELSDTCTCQDVFYCSKKCKYDDKPFHFKNCQEAYDSEDDEEYKKKSVYVDTLDIKCGLNNLGNTCYMNSSLQCLTNLPWLYEYFSSNKYSKLINKVQIQQNKGIFIHKFAKFIKKLKQYEEYNPYSLKGQISYFIPPFKGYSQHDANDFIIYLLNTLNDFTQKQDEGAAFSKFVSDNLVGKFKSLVRCPDCKVQSTTDDVYLQVSLPIKSKIQQKQIQYVRILEWNRYQKGAILVNNWEQINREIGQPIDCRKFIGNQGGDIVEIIQQSAQQIFKKHKKESLIFYSYLKSVPNTLEIKFNLAYSRVIAGNQMKSGYGYPIILQLDPKTKLMQVYKIVAELIGTQKQGLQEIQKLINGLEAQINQLKQKFLQQKNKKQLKKQGQNQPENQTAQNNQQQTAEKQKQEAVQLKTEIQKIQQKWNQQLTELRYKTKFRLVVVTARKGKKLCAYCGKKCSLCYVPFSSNTTISEFQKLGDHQLELDIFLDEKIEITETYSKTSTYNQYTTLQECLQEFSKPEQLDEQNAWYCQVCDMMRLAQKELQICSYPKTLILQLKRFKEHNGKKVKNNEVVWYPEILEIKGQQFKYRLSGVVVHEGSLDGGHYWAVCRKGQQYFLFNDSEVKKVGDYFQKGAYILVYEKV